MSTYVLRPAAYFSHHSLPRMFVRLIIRKECRDPRDGLKIPPALKRQEGTHTYPPLPLRCRSGFCLPQSPSWPSSRCSSCWPGAASELLLPVHLPSSARSAGPSPARRNTSRTPGAVAVRATFTCPFTELKTWSDISFSLHRSQVSSPGMLAQTICVIIYRANIYFFINQTCKPVHCIALEGFCVHCIILQLVTAVLLFIAFCKGIMKRLREGSVWQGAVPNETRAAIRHCNGTQAGLLCTVEVLHCSLPCAAQTRLSCSWGSWRGFRTCSTPRSPSEGLVGETEMTVF